MKRFAAVQWLSAVGYLILALGARPATLPGFRVVPRATPVGFCTSLAIDSTGRIYYTELSGSIYRLDPTGSTKIATVPTLASGNAGLLGMALVDDRTAVVHYTTATRSAEVISKIDLKTGTETLVKLFPSDPSNPNAMASTEHHGGNPTVADDGSIIFGIGDLDGFWIAADPAWNAGKIWRIHPDGTTEQLARGFRNPYDVAWDPTNQRVIALDNGDVVDDEIDVIAPDQIGSFYGWPQTAGGHAQVAGAVRPVYSFPVVVAPTGLVRLHGTNAVLPRGYLVGTFVTKSILYVPDLDAQPMPEPIALTAGDVPPIVDVTEGPRGEIVFTVGFGIYELVTPRRGDCDGNGTVDANDMNALERELADGGPHPTLTAQDGKYAASWGCDANGDGMIDDADRFAISRIVWPGRERTARH